MKSCRSNRLSSLNLVAAGNYSPPIPRQRFFVLLNLFLVRQGEFHKRVASVEVKFLTDIPTMSL
ncbi:MAG TPA: hypothetical protein VI756_00780, partial [Blastocatellia bacterium]